MHTNLYEHWSSEGYAIVRKIFDGNRAQRLLNICESILQQWYTKNPETDKPGGDANATVMRHLNHSGYFPNRSQEFRELMDAIADEKVLSACHTIFAEPPLFRCTSLFMNPTEKSVSGSWHRDSQFRNTDAEKEKEVILNPPPSGNSVQMQIALVPSDDVEFVPKSHTRWDTPAEYQIRRADGGKHNQSDAMEKAVRVHLDVGDAVLFNPFGIHRGRYHADKPRRTLMLTYTRTSKPRYDYFSHQPWFLEPDYMESLQPQTRAFFEPFVQTYKSQWVENQ